MVNQGTIAAAAGVSRAAVSIVLNDPDTRRVSAEVKERILQACATLGYSGDARGRRRRICITVNPRYGALEPYFSRLMAGIGPTAEAAGYAVVIKEVPAEITAEALLVNLNCDGVIAFGAIAADLAQEIDRRLPVVVLNQPELACACDMVGFDDHAGVATLVRHLVEQGHRRIAYVGMSDVAPTVTGERPCTPSARMSKRLGGFLAMSYGMGLRLDDDLVVTSAKAAELGLRDGHFFEDAIDQLLQLPAPPTAVMAFNDIMATSVIEHLHERGLRVPEDISVVGYDATAALKNLRLTSVDPGLDEVGRQAVSCLLARIAGAAPRAPVKMLTTPTLVVGNSVAARTAGVDQHPVPTP